MSESSSKDYICLSCGQVWGLLSMHKHRYCPTCRSMDIRENQSRTGFPHDGGGSRSARPVRLPALGALVWILRKSAETVPEAERYYDLEPVIEHIVLAARPIDLIFRTVSGDYAYSDHGKSWREAPAEYTAFLASLEISFEQFAKALARGGVEGVTGKIHGALTDWVGHNAQWCRGVAQEALRMLTKPDVKSTVESAISDELKCRMENGAALNRCLNSMKAVLVPLATCETVVRENADLKNQIAFARQVLGGFNER